MVDSIEPSYYARIQSEQARFVVRGHGFSLLPENLVAKIAKDNNNPDEYSTSDNAIVTLDVVSRTETEIVFEHLAPHSYNQPFYLGVFQEGALGDVVWANYTNPLP